MKILLVEDDYIQEQAIVTAIKKKFPDIQVSTICTELEFREKIDETLKNPPDMVILDVMIRWTDPGPGLDLESIPAEVLEGGAYRAGLRCERIWEDRLPRTPIVFYSVLEEKDMKSEFPNRPRVYRLSKNSDPTALLKKIQDWKDKLPVVHQNSL